MIVAQVLGGMVLLVVGGDAFVRGAVAIARRLRVSPLMIGLTLVGFGTSTPEMVTSIQAALVGSPGIAIGNVVGSNIANVLLILGLAALVYPMRTSREAFRRDGLVLLGVALLCVAVALSGHLARAVGVGLVSLLALYVLDTLFRERVKRDAAAEVYEAEASAVGTGARRTSVALVLTASGLLCTILGSHLLVAGAIDVARGIGVSESVVGVTIVAVGTSLPELVTSVTAAIRRQADVAFGNVIGSNIFNVLGILGTTAIVRPVPVPPQLVRLDVWVMLASTSLLLVCAISGWRLSRWEGGLFLVAYGVYVTVLVLTGA